MFFLNKIQTGDEFNCEGSSMHTRDGVRDGTLPVALGRVSELAACTDCQFSAGEAGESTLQSQGGAMRRD